MHGDYDVDGITSTVILRRALELLGGEVIHFIPERLRDGYGLQPAALERLHAEGVHVVVSVDCGIRGADAARRARELGIDLIITDHHEPDTELPQACAVVNPKRHDCTLPGQASRRRRRRAQARAGAVHAPARSTWLPAFVKIAAIGTLADVVPLVGENRVIAKLGLQLLSKGPHKVGLRALLDVAGPHRQADRQLSHRVHGRAARQRRRAHEHAGHRHPPAACRRRGMADEARGLAEQLETENTRRRQEEQDIVAKARKVIETDPEVGSRLVLVVAGEGWHRGVIGIVASKIVDTFYRPAIVLSIEDGVAHGSCRSIPGFDMLAALESCAPMMLRFGGHKQAAGLQIESGAHQGVPPRRQRLGRGRACRPTICGRGCGSTVR